MDFLDECDGDTQGALDAPVLRTLQERVEYAGSENSSEFALGTRELKVELLSSAPLRERYTVVS